MTVNVGDQFLYVSKDVWTNGGRDFWHTFRLHIEITDIDHGQASWRTIEVLAETGRPPVKPKDTPQLGGFRVEFYTDLVNMGTIAPWTSSDPLPQRHSVADEIRKTMYFPDEYKTQEKP